MTAELFDLKKPNLKKSTKAPAGTATADAIIIMTSP
jgi:hypothetical protein